MEENSPSVTLYPDGSYYVGDDTEIDEHTEITIFWPNGKKSLWVILAMEAP